jgi:hypothetical protein
VQSLITVLSHNFLILPNTAGVIFATSDNSIALVIESA